jgi:hypothetical protein
MTGLTNLRKKEIPLINVFVAAKMGLFGGDLTSNEAIRDLHRIMFINGEQFTASPHGRTVTTLEIDVLCEI